jgi:hypothetical protein
MKNINENHNILKDAGSQRKVRYNLQNGLLITLYNTLQKQTTQAHSQKFAWIQNICTFKLKKKLVEYLNFESMNL